MIVKSPAIETAIAPTLAGRCVRLLQWMPARLQSLFDHVCLDLLRRLTIRHRLILSFIALSLLPLTILGGLSYTASSRAIQEQSSAYSIEIARQVAQSFQLQMSQVEAASEDFILSDRVQKALGDYYQAGADMRPSARSELTRSLLEKYGSFDYVNQKYLLDAQFNMMDTQVFSRLREGVVRIAQTAAEDGRPTWTRYRGFAGQSSIVLLRKIHGKRDNRPVGTLFIGLKASRFSSIFKNVFQGDDTGLFVVDIDDGRIIVDGRAIGPMLSSTTADAALVRQIGVHTQAAGDSASLAFTSADGQAYRAAYAHIPNTTWYVVNAASLESLMAQPRAMRNKVILIGLICFLCALAFSAAISRSISTPLDSLVRIMQQTEAGNYRMRLPAMGADEVTTLAGKFNAMARRVHEQNERLEERVAERTRDLAQATRALEVLSTTDGLTGIANRRRFDQFLTDEMNRASRLSEPLTLLMLDVDLFKNYNDLYGHHAGDECLRAIAALLQSRARRASDLAARYGGEEFALICANTSAATALELAQSICSALTALALPHAHSPFGCVTLSIGVATLVPAAGIEARVLIERADGAMYHAKNTGRNRACEAVSTTDITQASAA
ncbi:MAG: diguanylate cyclase [Herminiimonas sp.]|nr:diguanylate cyclase [Herminiimonas sp.]